MRKPKFGLLTCFFVLLATISSHAFNLIEGTVTEFTSPDDILLDPASAVIAVDLYGNQDNVVNGVTFHTDRDGLGAGVTAEGVVTVGAVTLTTGLVNQIDNWAAAPAFTGTDGPALAEVMRDIRWQAAPNPIEVTITGLTPGTLYHLQLLTNEGADRNRRWDIGVDGVLVADDYSSEGGDGTWTANNSFAYAGCFDPGEDGTLSIAMQQQIGGEPNAPTDNNPILQAVVLHEDVPGAPSSVSLTAGPFLSNVAGGTPIGTLSSSDRNCLDTHTYTLVAGEGDADNGSFEIVDGSLQTSGSRTDEGDRVYSIRVRSEDSGGLSLEASFQVTALDASADPDGDGLNNGDEAIAGTDPNNPDTDGDGLLDGEEVHCYGQNFDALADGATDLSDGSTLLGNANFTPSVQGQRLFFTANTNSNNSALHFPISGAAGGFTVSFDFELSDASANPPADGFSFSYGDLPAGALSSQPEEGWPGVPNVLSFEVDTWNVSDAEVGPAIGLSRPSPVPGNSLDVSSLAHTNGPILGDEETVSGTATISWSPTNGATFITTGLTTNANFVNVPTPGFSGDDAFTFALAARTGGANEDLYFDNIKICAFGTDPLDADSDNDGLSDGAEINRFGPPVSVGIGAGHPADGVDSAGTRMNIQTSDGTVLNLPAGTYSVADFAFSNSTATDDVQPFLVIGTGPNAYEVVWVGPTAAAPGTDAIVTAPYGAGTQTFTLTAAADVYAGFNAAGPAVKFGDGLTDHNNPADFGIVPGTAITSWTNPNLGRSYAFAINVGSQQSTDPNNPDTDGGGRPDGTDPDPLDPNVEFDTEVLAGEVFEILGPDDLNLDPANAVIAVDLFGDMDRDVNGVLFQTDGQVNGGGSATNGSVTVTTTAPNQINGWAAPPNFVGGTPDSAANLAEIMSDIRWNGAPNPVAVDIDGLTPGETYEILILTNEGRLRTRSHDISVGGSLVADNYSSSGVVGRDNWTPDNSFGWRGEVVAPAGGIINILLQEDLGGAPPLAGTDHNPVLQAVVVQLVPQHPSVQPSFVPIVGAGGAYQPDFDNPGIDYQENHYNGGVIFNNNAQNNYDVHVSGVPAPLDSQYRVEPIADHGAGGNLGNNLPFITGGENFTVRVNGFLDMTGFPVGEYIIHLGADDTNLFIMNTFDGTVNSQHNCCPADHQMAFTITQTGCFPFDNVFGEQGGGDWYDISISGPGLDRVALGDTANGSPPVYPIILDSDDSDGDDLADAWENVYTDDLNDLTGLAAGPGPGAGTGDFDGDGCSDLEEFGTGTDPTNPDSDGDGLSDGDEKTAGTDPLNPDSDGDGLSDGDEVNVHSTDPNNPDSDGDGFPDGAEVEAGSDPNNAGSQPGLTLLAYFNFNDPENPGAKHPWALAPDVVLGGNATQTEDGFNGGALDLGAHNDGSQAKTPEGDHFSAINGSNPYSVSFWQLNRQNTASTSSFWVHAPGSAANQRGIQAHVPWGNGTIFYDQSGCCAGGERLTVGGLTIQDQWQHFVFQKDRDGNRTIWVDGVEVASAAGGDPIDEPGFNGILTIGAEGPNNANSLNGKIDDFAIFDRNLNADQIAFLAGGGTPSCLLPTQLTSLGTGTAALLGNDLTDLGDDGIDAAGAEADLAGNNWDFVDAIPNEEPGFEGGEFAFNIFDNKLGAGNDKWCCNGRDITIEFPNPVSVTHFTIGSANDVENRDWRVFRVQGSNDGATFETFYENPGEERVWTARLEVVRFDLCDPTPFYKFIRFEADTNWGDGLWQLGEIEVFGSIPPNTDSDGDGLPDFYENENGLDPNDPADAGSDLDNDGLTALQEFQIGTDPNDPDTDDDGLLDGQEVPSFPAGVVGHWNFDDGTASDSSGNGNDGTLQNGATIVAEVPNSTAGTMSLALAGGTQHVLVPHDASLDIPSEITITAWVKPQNAAWDGIIAKSPGDGSGANFPGNFELRTNNGGGILEFLYENNPDDDGLTTVTATTALVGNEWAHIAFTASSGGTYAFYINGVDAGNGPMADNFGLTNTNPLYIGSRADLFTTFDGNVDEVCLFNSALSAAQIADIAANGAVAPSTDPFNPDSDGDGLSDGDEVNVHGTDPLSGDTDGDGFTDAQEVAAGSDPTDPSSTPPLPDPLAYYDFEEGAGASADDFTDWSGNGNNGTINGDVSFGAGAPGSSTPCNGAVFNGGFANIPGIDAPSQLANRDSNPDGSYTFSAWLKPDAESIGGDHFFWGQTNQGIHNGLRGSGTLHTAHWGSDFNANTVLTANQWIHAVWTYDGPNDTARVYLNGVLDGGPFGQIGPQGGGNLILGGRNNGDAPFFGMADDVAVWQEVLALPHIQALAAGLSPVDTQLQDDLDGDGLPDLWEAQNGGDLDPLADDDSDGLTNTEELAFGSDPNNPDTDGDGLSDGDEANAGTSPCNSDTDGDGLSDSDEINVHGSDPTLVDTDGDGFSDPDEVAAGTDPADPDSIPALPGPLAYFDFEQASGVLVEDWSGNGNNGDIVDNVTFGEGAPGSSTPCRGGLFSVGGAGYINIPGIDAPSQLAHRDSNPDGSYTLSAWLKPDAVSLSGDRFFFGQTSQGIHNGLRGNGSLNTAHWGSDFSASTALSADQWIHALWTYDGPTDTARIYLNGVLDGGPFAQLGPNGSGNLILGGRNGGTQNFVGCADDVAVWPEVLSAGHIQLLANGASPIRTALLVDDDFDGMPDAWEARHGVDDPFGDADGDGLNNRREYQEGLDPNDPDSDDDGLQDDVEIFLGLNPCNPDIDGDGLTDGEELGIYGSDPRNAESDGDGIPDGLEVAKGLDPSRNDLLLDYNRNGWANIFEFLFCLDARAVGPTPVLDVDVPGGVINTLGTPTTYIEEIPNGVNYCFLYARNKDFTSVGLQSSVIFSHDLNTFFPSEGDETIVADDGSVEIVKVNYPFLLPNGRKPRFWQVVIEPIAP